MTKTLYAFSLAAILGLSAVARAQDSTKAAPPPPPPFASITADLGYVNTTGNSNVSTLNASDALTLRPSARNQVDQTLSLVYGMSHNRVQTNQWAAMIKDEYKFKSFIGLYALGEYTRNPFAGIDHSYEEDAGVAFTAVDDSSDHFEIDAGGSYVEQHLLPDSSNKHAGGRLALLYKHNFMKTTYIQETLEGLPDFDLTKDFRINSQTDVVAPLSKHLAIKVGYAIHYANLPPTGFKTTDRLFTSDLQVTY